MKCEFCCCEAMSQICSVKFTCQIMFGIFRLLTGIKIASALMVTRVLIASINLEQPQHS